MVEIVEIPRRDPERDPGFCVTSTSEQILLLLDRQQRHPEEGTTVILGGPGIGKTQTVRKFGGDHKASDIYYLRAKSLFGSPTELRKAIAKTLDVPVERNRYDTENNILLRIRDDVRRASWDHSKDEPVRWPMIVFDEISYFDVAALAFLRGLWMDTNDDGRAPGLAIVMVGNREAEHQFRGLLAQDRGEAIGRRIWQFKYFPRSTTEDVSCFSRHHGITRPELIAALQHAAEREGLDGVRRAIVIARDMAAADGKALGVRHVEAAIAERPFRARGARD